MTCMDCLVISGYVSPPVGASVPWSPIMVPPTPLFFPTPDYKLGANNMYQHHEETYMHKMRYALQEMDRQFEFVPNGAFLDLGCCPGGFSTYVLSKWPYARGVGVSLPIQFGGHSLAVPLQLRNRLELHWADVTMFNLAPTLLEGCWDTSIFTPCPIPIQSFDFVMVDGHQPPSMLIHDPRISWSRDRLLLSQLLVALRAVKPGGTLLAKLSLQVSVPLMERIVLALSRLSYSPVRAIKPTSIYATAATFYILAQALDLARCAHMARILEGLWYFMTFGGSTGFGRGLKDSDMDLIATYPDVLAAKMGLKALFAPIEEVRLAAKAGLLPKV
ncbi:FtsJ-like methyltransferase [Ceratobasidium sp. AG-Ba]|nr:FtsJ-like methyltransferase [Ceratobasidium sp. AG-Ba]QRW10847.1 FtsJ-like methyltransferase [Ceratobasidium sp. AG-Ba]